MRLHALRRSLEIMGNPERLRCYLGGVPASWLQSWLSGHATPPQAIFLRAADLVLAHKLSRVRGAVRDATSKGIEISLGGQCARCPACDNTRFTQIAPDHAPADRTSLACTFCELRIPRSDLVALSETKAPDPRAADGKAPRRKPSGVTA